MYMGLRVMSMYIREKGIKLHVQQIIGVFRDDLGNIKGTIFFGVFLDVGLIHLSLGLPYASRSLGFDLPLPH